MQARIAPKTTSREQDIHNAFLDLEEALIEVIADAKVSDALMVSMDDDTLTDHEKIRMDDAFRCMRKPVNG
jgi:hypothetical protein